MERRYHFLEGERLHREAQHDQREQVMVMCPMCNRSVPEGMQCMVCVPCGVPADKAAQGEDLDRPKVW